MEEMIATRRTSEVKEQRYDLFSALLDANELDGEGHRLLDEELIGEFINSTFCIAFERHLRLE